MKRPIAIGLSPNLESDDVKVAFKTILSLNSWAEGKSLIDLSDWFKNYFHVNNIFLFNSGRTALYALLKSFGIGDGDEVIIQGFTCVAVPDPILWVGGKPVYVDISDDLNINHNSLEKAINKKTKAIIVQHTLGNPAKIKEISKITQKYNLILIEDCAHVLGADVEGIKLGKWGHAAFFSFGRDKVVSSVFGGAAFINTHNKKAIDSLFWEYNRMPKMNNSWIFKQLLHPLLFLIILPLYNLNLGKLILFLLLKLNLVTKPVESIEKTAGKPSFFPGKLPNALAVLALHQLSKLEKFNRRRKEIAGMYFSMLENLKGIKLPNMNKDSIYLRFNIRIEKDRDKFFKFFKKNKIILGNWYTNIIDPAGVDFDKICYKKGSLPNAERIASESINLPTYPTLDENEVKTITNLIKAYANRNY